MAYNPDNKHRDKHARHLPNVLDSIKEQVESAQKFGVRLRYVSVRHDQVNELANLFVKSITDKKGHDDGDLMQRAVDAINQGTARWQQWPIVVVGAEGEA